MPPKALAKAPGKYVHGCLAPNCTSKYYSPIRDPNFKNKLFFKFPSDINRRREWFNISNLPFILKRCYLCEDHFKENDFTNTFKNRLLKHATPSFKRSQDSDSSDKNISNLLSVGIENIEKLEEKSFSPQNATIEEEHNSPICKKPKFSSTSFRSLDNIIYDIVKFPKLT